MDLMIMRRTKTFRQLMPIQIQPTLVEKIRIAQKGDSRLRQFRGETEARLREDFRIHPDGELYLRDRICVPKGEVRDEVLAEVHSSTYSVWHGRKNIRI